MIKNFINRAKQGESVFLGEIRDAFNLTCDQAIEIFLETATNETHRWKIPIPASDEIDEKEFIRDYFYANIYNIISAYGGKYMILNYQPDDYHIKDLTSSLDTVFQVSTRRVDRSGYGKCLNVTDRINASMGLPPFKFILTPDPINNNDSENNHINGSQINQKIDPVEKFRNTVKKSENMILIGLDIGGTDIKAVGTVNGKIISFKEFDWDPAGMIKSSDLITGVTALVKEICEDLHEYGKPDAIGVGYPDVVINNRIVGGETMKTRGIRNASDDYESEFAGLLGLNEKLLSFCKPSGNINMTNDGFLAAFTAAVEIAHSNNAQDVNKGIFAHTLGTELGTGTVNEFGEVPQIPMEIYACIIDMGNYPAREYEPFDIRSTLNFNTDLPGTMQKYTSQSGAYRLALEYFKKNAPDRYNELFEKRFIEEKNKGIYVVTSPEDMRKPFLAHLMNLADEGQPQAENIFKEIGRYLAAIWHETNFLLCPENKERILYGRFIKSPKCMALMHTGITEKSNIKMTPGNDDLAYTKLMIDLKNNPDHTVAQFGQAVGAAYFAVM